MLDDALARRRAGVRETYELKWRHSDGSEVWALVSASPLSDERGAVRRDLRARHRHHRAPRAPSTGSSATRASRRRSRGLGRLALEGMRAAARCSRRRRGASREVLGASEVALVPAPFEPGGGVRSSVRVAGAQDHGALAIRHADGWQPTADELTFLEAIANTLAAAIERAEAEAEMRRRALHDPLTGLPEPHARARPPRARARGARAPRRAPPPSCCSTSTSSRSSTTRSATTPATSSCSRSRRGSSRRCARATPSGASAATSSSSCARASPTRAGAAAVAERLVARVRRAVRARRRGAPPDRERRRSRSPTTRRRSPGDLLRNADAAMYRAKERRPRALRDVRRGAARAHARAACSSSASCARPSPRDELDARLPADRRAGRRHGRGRRGAGALAPPAARARRRPTAFIGMAEDAGLIGAIGAWVLREACAHGGGAGSGARPLTLHVNLSPRQVDGPGAARRRSPRRSRRRGCRRRRSCSRSPRAR